MLQKLYWPRYITVSSLYLVFFVITNHVIGQQQLDGLKADRILFLGNSLTLHPPKPEIGWTGNWGMFASQQDKDYVHILTKLIDARTGGKLILEPSPVVGHTGTENIINIANILERDYRSYDTSKIAKQLAWKPDIVILQFGANVPKNEFDPEAFQKALNALLKDLKAASDPQIFIAGNIILKNSKLDQIKRKACKEDPDHRTFIDISTYQFSTDVIGSLNHPNDKGMQLIAETLFAGIIRKASRPVNSVTPIAAFAPKSRILFQGDSITDGNRGRNSDPNHILGHGYVFIIAARHGAAFPDSKLEFINRGISGNTVLDLEKRWNKDTFDLKPDILSVLIGVNDSGQKIPLDQFEQVYDKLLSDARATNPKLKIVLCEPFQLDHESVTAPTKGSPFPDIVKRQEIVQLLASKHNAPVVSFQKVLDEACKRAPANYWVWDGVHPTYAGHQLLADEWERVVRNYWKKK